MSTVSSDAAEIAVKGDQDALRAEIDALDAAIAALLTDRVRVSRALQANRVSSGGARVDLRREREVISHYTDLLGWEGVDIALALLVFSRGKVSAPHANGDEPQG